MKNLTPSFLLALIALTGCGAAVDDATELDFAGHPGADVADDKIVDGAPADDVAAEDADLAADGETIGTSQQALISTGGALGAKRWCAARKTCYDNCDADFPVGDSTNTSCKARCDISTAPKCRPDTVAGGGIFIF